MELMWKLCYVIALTGLLTLQASAAPRFQTKYTVPVVRPIVESDFDRGKEYLLATTSPLSVIDVVDEKKPLDRPSSRLSWRDLGLSSPVVNDVLPSGQYYPWRLAVQPATVITGDKDVTSGQNTVYWRVPDLSTLVSDEVSRFHQEEIRREEFDPSLTFNVGVSNDVQYFLHMPWRVPLSDGGGHRILLEAPSPTLIKDTRGSGVAFYVKRVPWWIPKSSSTHFNPIKVQSELSKKTVTYKASGFIVPFGNEAIPTVWNKQRTQHRAFLATLIKKKTVPYNVYIAQSKVEVPVIVKEELYIRPIKTVLKEAGENATMNDVTPESSTANRMESKIHGTGSNYLSSNGKVVHIDSPKENTSNKHANAGEQEENFQDANIVNDHHIPIINYKQDTTTNNESEWHMSTAEADEDRQETKIAEKGSTNVQTIHINVSRPQQTDIHHTEKQVSNMAGTEQEKLEIGNRESKAVDQLVISTASTTNENKTPNSKVQENNNMVTKQMITSQNTRPHLVTVINETKITTENQRPTEHLAINVSTVMPTANLDSKSFTIEDSGEIVNLPEKMMKQGISNDGGRILTVVNETTITSVNPPRIEHPAVDVSTVQPSSLLDHESRSVDVSISSKATETSEHRNKITTVQESNKIVPETMMEQNFNNDGSRFLTVINKTTITIGNQHPTEHQAINVSTVIPTANLDSKSFTLEESSEIVNLPEIMMEQEISNDGGRILTVVNGTTITSVDPPRIEHPAVDVSTVQPSSLLDHESRAVEVSTSSKATETSEQRNKMTTDQERGRTVLPKMLMEEKITSEVEPVLVTVINETKIRIENQHPTQHSAIDVSTLMAAENQDSKSFVIEESSEIVNLPGKIMEQEVSNDGGRILTVVNETTITSINPPRIEHPTVDVSTVQPSSLIDHESRGVNLSISSKSTETNEQRKEMITVQESSRTVLPELLMEEKITSEVEPVLVSVINETKIRIENQHPTQHSAIDVSTLMAAENQDSKRFVIEESSEIVNLPGKIMEQEVSNDGWRILTVVNATTITSVDPPRIEHPAVDVSTVQPSSLLDHESRAVDVSISSKATETNEQRNKITTDQESSRTVLPKMLMEEKITSEVEPVLVSVINETKIRIENQHPTQHSAIDVSTLMAAENQDSKSFVIEESSEIVNLPEKIMEQEVSNDGGRIVTVVNATTITSVNPPRIEHPAVDVSTVQPSSLLDHESRAVDVSISSKATETSEQRNKMTTVQESNKIVPETMMEQNFNNDGGRFLKVINKTTITIGNQHPTEHQAINVSTVMPTANLDSKSFTIEDSGKFVNLPEKMMEQEISNDGVRILTVVNETTITSVDPPRIEHPAVDVSTVQPSSLLDHESRSVDVSISSKATETSEQRNKMTTVQESSRTVLPKMLMEETITSEVEPVLVSVTNETKIRIENQHPTEHSAIDVSTLTPADNLNSKGFTIEESGKIVNLPEKMLEQEITDDAGRILTEVNEFTIKTENQPKLQHSAIGISTASPVSAQAGDIDVIQGSNDMVSAISTDATEKSDVWSQHDGSPSLSETTETEMLSRNVDESVEGRRNSLNQLKSGKVYVVTTKVTEVQKVITDEIPNADVTKEVKHAVRKPDGSIVIITTSYRVVPASPGFNDNAFGLNRDEMSLQRDGSTNHFQTMNSNSASISDAFVKSYGKSISSLYSGGRHAVLSSVQPRDQRAHGGLNSNIQSSLSPSGVYNSASDSIQQQSRQLSSLFESFKDATFYDRMESKGETHSPALQV